MAMSMGRDRPSLWIVLFCSIISPIVTNQYTVSAEENTDYPIIIDISLDDGTILTDVTTITVYIENENQPDSVTWELLSSGASFSFVNVTDNMEIHDSQLDRKYWSFDITIDAQTTSSCSCVLIIQASETGNLPIEESRSFFVSDSSAQLPPTIYVKSLYGDNWFSHVQTLNGISSAMNGDKPDISYAIQESPTVKCRSDDVTMQASEKYYPEVAWLDNEFTISLDVSDSIDGWHDIYLTSRDLLTALTTTFCLSVRVDNTPPTVSIEGPGESSEGFSMVNFDGSDTDDYHWGRSGLVYVWSVNEIVGPSSRNVLVQSGENVRSISIETSISGIYEISLTAIDNAGNSATGTQPLIIENIAPIARLLIDGIPVFDGDEINIPKTSSFTIDAKDSSDTENDLDGLRYVWRVDNVPVYEGSGREMFWPDDAGGRFILTLEVIDDDYVSSMISVTIMDNDTGFSFPVSLLIFLISACFLGYASSRRMHGADSDSDIPKWV
tara:strand:- start:6306 stop:7796 length:1491 start_codon:yes stop_codon:yes gene_type:complete